MSISIVKENTTEIAKDLEQLNINSNDTKVETNLINVESKIETYLDLIDEYETLRYDLLNHFSSGFIKLVRANYVSSGFGKTYGKDFYDETVQSIKRIKIKDDDNLKVPVLTIEDLLLKQKLKQKQEKEEEEEKEKTEIKSADDTKNGSTTRHRKKINDTKSEEKSTVDYEGVVTTGSSKTKEIKKEKSKIKDPLNMFGGLVPPVLRESQKEFNSSINAIIDLVNITKKLGILSKQLEISFKESDSRVDGNDDRNDSDKIN